jgi:hypothetical protein
MGLLTAVGGQTYPCVFTKYIESLHTSLFSHEMLFGLYNRLLPYIVIMKS